MKAHLAASLHVPVEARAGGGVARKAGGRNRGVDRIITPFVSL